MFVLFSYYVLTIFLLFLTAEEEETRTSSTLSRHDAVSGPGSPSRSPGCTAAWIKAATTANVTYTV